MDAQDAEQQRFDQAVGVARLTTGLSNDDKLRMYGLYKQAMGETMGERPGIFNVTNRAKVRACALDAHGMLTSAIARLESGQHLMPCVGAARSGTHGRRSRS